MSAHRPRPKTRTYFDMSRGVESALSLGTARRYSEISKGAFCSASAVLRNCIAWAFGLEEGRIIIVSQRTRIITFHSFCQHASSERPNLFRMALIIRVHSFRPSQKLVGHGTHGSCYVRPAFVCCGQLIIALPLFVLGNAAPRANGFLRRH